MTSLCPCGCGRSIGFSARVLAKRGLFIDSLLAVPDYMWSLAPDNEERDSWAKIVRLGDWYRDTFLAIAHGDDPMPRRAPEQFAEFRRDADLWEAHALNLARQLRVEDERWYAAWGGPTYHPRVAVGA